MVALIATAQAGVAQGAIAPAIAGELVEYVSDFGGLLVNVNLPRILEVFARELSARKNRRLRRNLQRSRRMIGRNIIGWVRPLGVADCGERGDGDFPAPIGD